MRDHGAAVTRYKRALELGGTASLPEIYHTAGVKLVFDAETMRELVQLVEERIASLRKMLATGELQAVASASLR